MKDPRLEAMRMRRRLTAAEWRVAVLERRIAGLVAAQQLAADEMIDLRERVAARPSVPARRIGGPKR